LTRRRVTTPSSTSCGSCWRSDGNDPDCQKCDEADPTACLVRWNDSFARSAPGTAPWRSRCPSCC
jgi:hypothetical protein